MEMESGANEQEALRNEDYELRRRHALIRRSFHVLTVFHCILFLYTKPHHHSLFSLLYYRTTDTVLFLVVTLRSSL
jgi:hypothetical protein